MLTTPSVWDFWVTKTHVIIRLNNNPGYKHRFGCVAMSSNRHIHTNERVRDRVIGLWVTEIKGIELVNRCCKLAFWC